ncbi:MAG: hypothetical protein PUE13_00955 [Clostridiales bacterium]|nr:hypothetical protein [Clostridiales bacterium]
MYRIDNIKVPVGVEITKEHIAKRAGIHADKIGEVRIIKKAIDARRKSNVHFVYTALIDTAEKLNNLMEYSELEYTFPTGKPRKMRPLITGFGPCGIFAALMLAENGYRPIVIERGADVDTREALVEQFWKSGSLDVKTNVQFGEGGAGTFSDGKLNSGIHDRRCRFVLETFAKYGAPEEITYAAKPHIGTDVLSEVVKNMRKRIIECGGEVRFLNKLTGIITKDGRVCGAEVETDSGKYTIETDVIVLAIGHSARDTYRMLADMGTKIEQKNFSVGVRIEHRQSMINRSRYGEFADRLGAADYKLAAHFDGGRSAYTFCMCPGGVVVASNSEEGTVVTNGMSYFARSGENANSALLVNVTTDDFNSSDPLAGVDFQEKIERRAFRLAGGNYNAPCQYVGDFLGVKAEDRVLPSYRPGVTFCNISEIFPDFVTDTIRKAIPEFDKKLKGFADGGAVMTAPETRSSAPCRIVRAKDSLMSNFAGIFPGGEGAGYAGGIMSAATDGIKIAEAIAKWED